MLRGVVFDFDGVIVDSHAVHMRAWRKFLGSMGLAASDEQLQFVLDGRKREDILCHFLGTLSPEKLMEYGAQKEKIFRDEAEHVLPVSGLLAFLRELETFGIAMSVASSGSRARVEFLMQQLELRHRFQIIVTGDEVEHGKPHPAVFLTAAQRLGIDPSELLAFEDAVSGVKAATAAGMKCVGVAPAQRAHLLLNAGAYEVISDFALLSYAEIEKVFIQ